MRFCSSSGTATPINLGESGEGGSSSMFGRTRGLLVRPACNIQDILLSISVILTNE